MRSLLICFFCLYCLPILAQDAWLVSSNSHFETNPVKEAIPIVNTTTGDFAVFYKVKKGFIAELYNNKKELLHKATITNVPSGNLVGYVYEKNMYTLYFSNNSMSKMSCVKVDFVTGISYITKDLNLDLKGEKAIQFITDENKLYLLTIQRRSSVLKLYAFDLHGGFKERNYDLSDKVFENDNKLTYTLYSFLFIANKLTQFESIDSSLPCSLEQASAPTKIFSQKGKAVLTINLTDRFTYVIDLDLNKSQYDFKKIENEHFKRGNYLNTHNSFLIDDVLFDAYITNEKVVLSLIDLKNNTLLKEFTVTEKEAIKFKNTPIIQEGGSFDDYREFEKTTKFFRKILHSKMALSAYKSNANYIVTLGSYEPRPGTLTMVGGMIGGLTGAMIFSMFDSYSNSKSVRVLSLIDDNFNHVQGNIPQNGFDKINNFIEDKKLKRLDAQTIFKYNGSFIWGAYNDVAKMYRFYQF